MADDVKFVFKTLIKVPLTVIIAYMVMNIILFANFYFKYLGYSYIVMQTVYENNYLPTAEQNTLLATANDTLNNSDLIYRTYICVDTNSGTSDDEFKRQMGVNDKLVIDNNATSFTKASATVIGSNNKRVQYGKKIQVHVGYVFKMMLPFNHTNNQSKGNVLDWTRRATYIPITFNYNVTGLKYYGDLK